MAPSWDGRMKVSTNGLCHMTKMATMPIYAKILSKSSSLEPKGRCTRNLVCSIKYCQVYSNDAPGLTLTYFTARSNLVPYAFLWGKIKTMDFSEIIVVYDIKVGRCSQLNDYTKLYEYCTKGQGHSLTLVPITKIQYF